MKQIYKNAVDHIELNETEKAHIFYRVRNAEREAAQPKRNMKRRVGAILTAALALVLVFTITLNSMPVAATLAEPNYPSLKTALTDEVEENYLNALRNFAYSTVAAVDRGADGNTVYTPYGMSVLLSMLAELTARETRQEILDLFDVSRIEELTAASKQLYGKLYSAEGDYICRPVQSIWLDNGVDYNLNTLEIVAQNQYAASYNVPFSHGRASDAVTEWLKGEMGVAPNQPFFKLENKMMIATGFLFRSEWQENFAKEQVYEDVFYGTTLTDNAIYMNKVGNLNYLQTQEATAAKIALAEGCSVVFILPDEDLGLDGVLNDSALLENIVSATLASEKQNVAVSIPSTSFEEKLDIGAIMGQLGVVKAFDKYEADFSALSSDEGVYAGEIISNTVMDLREEGEVEKGETAFTASNMLTLNRPFAYVVVSEEEVPLMIGVVENAMQMEE